MFREFFYMHKSDRRVILTLLVVAAVAIAVLMLTGGKKQKTPISSKETAISASKESSSSATANTPIQSTGLTDDTPEEGIALQEKADLFPFDPNTADSLQLQRLGLPPTIIHNIYKYRSAGGVFTKKEDFARLYGLTVKQYRELEPYIRISPDYQPAATLFQRKGKAGDDRALQRPVSPESPDNPDNPGSQKSPGKQAYSHKLSPGETLDLSTADTTALMRIPGIGAYFARRIADYGRRLGGYVSLSQLDEIDGFPAEAKQYMTLSRTEVTKLNVNTLSLNELKRHPYLNYYQARAIVDYRRQHGPIGNLHDLHLLPDFPEEAISRLLPYVEY